MRKTEFCTLWGFVIAFGILPLPLVSHLLPEEVFPAVSMALPLVAFVLVHFVGPGIERHLCRILRLPPPYHV